MQTTQSLWNNSRLNDDVAFWLRLAEMTVMKRVADALRPFELRPALYAVMVLIEANPGRKQHEVGEALRVAASNLGVLMETLARRGLIERERTPGDVRSYALTLTAAGADLLAEVKAALDRVLADTDRIIGDRREPFLAVLSDLAGHTALAPDA